MPRDNNWVFDRMSIAKQETKKKITREAHKRGNEVKLPLIFLFENAAASNESVIRLFVTRALLFRFSVPNIWWYRLEAPVNAQNGIEKKPKEWMKPRNERIIKRKRTKWQMEKDKTKWRKNRRKSVERCDERESHWKSKEKRIMLC